MALAAGRDLNLQAAQGVASGAVTAQAGNNINLLSATETQHTFFEETTVKKKAFSKTVTHTLRETLQTDEKSSPLSSDSVTMAANQDINLQGSSVVGDKQVTLLANHDVNTAASVENYQNYEEHNAVENNNFNLSNIAPKGLQDVGALMTSLYTNTNMVDENGNVLNPITEEQRQYAMHKLVTGTMPEGQDISEAIVDGYTNGVLIAGAWYLGPAASIGKVAVGSALSGGANAAYQWYDLSQKGNENKTYDYWGTTAAGLVLDNQALQHFPDNRLLVLE
ncbi:hemagglutinin repeat-containing protein [Pectobacterium parvum]|uniref:hemagglutinin repeat-containing protein n=1 Tax=Pectobacterium parvum TaxID=2778550 RepID=UPI0037FCD689